MHTLTTVNTWSAPGISQCYFFSSSVSSFNWSFLGVLKSSITQVTDLLEGLRCLELPLLCERIMEVPVREWAVAPALQKDGSYCIRKPPVLPGDEQAEAAEVASNPGDFTVKPRRRRVCVTLCWLSWFHSTIFREDHWESARLWKCSLYCQTSSWTDEPHR